MALARYGDLEFAIFDKKIATLSLEVAQTEIEVPKNLVMKIFENPQLEIATVKNILTMNNITWERVDMLCDNWIDYYRTSTGVHLSFGGSLLGKVGVANLEKFWGI